MPGQYRPDQGVLAVVVLVEAPLGHARRRRDVIHADTGLAAFVKQVEPGPVNGGKGLGG